MSLKEPAGASIIPFNQTNARALVVSIHDVSPHTFPATKRIVSDLEELGVHRFSFLVVPDHHHRGHILDDQEFCVWLKERVAGGDEAIIHGCFHYRKPKENESLIEKFTTRLYTKGEGEFFDMPGADAIRIVSHSRAEFRKLGLNPRGFIAPAWLLSEPAERALRLLGFAYTTKLATVIDFDTDMVYQSQALVWSTRSWWRRIVSRIWNPVLFRRLRENKLMRISIHPPDREYGAVWRQISELTRRSLSERTAFSYLEWIEKIRKVGGATTDPTTHALQS